MSSLKCLSPDLERASKFIERHSVVLPESPGIYRFIGDKNQVLYVGKAKHLKKRVLSYSHVARLPKRLQRMVCGVQRIDVVMTGSESEALLLEASLIKKLQPPYNILFKDDKTQAYIVITQETWPWLRWHKGKALKKTYTFGPFASKDAVRQALTSLQQAFLLRSCAPAVFHNRQRPCLLYDIKRCSGPCVGHITQKSYDVLVKQALSFLRGHSQTIQKKITQQMNKESQEQNYERAALLRDRLQALNNIQSHQLIHRPSLKDTDIISFCQQAGQGCMYVSSFQKGTHYGGRPFFVPFTETEPEERILSLFLGQFYEASPPPPVVLTYIPLSSSCANALKEAWREKFNITPLIECPQKGFKKEVMDGAILNGKEELQRYMHHQKTTHGMLKNLENLFQLPACPQRIEVYDNSHLFGRFPVGVMVVAGPEGFLPKEYRKFKITNTPSVPKGGDDLSMMRYVLEKRFSSQKIILPDLVIVDGGSSQLEVARSVFAQKNLLPFVPLVSMAKGPKRQGDETFHLPGKKPFKVSHEPTLHYLQRLRDEAHRYAISSHRALRERGLSSSFLEEIPGIGQERKKALLRYFGSIKSIGAASVSDLQKVQGIHLNLAHLLYEKFRQKNPEKD